MIQQKHDPWQLLTGGFPVSVYADEALSGKQLLPAVQRVDEHGRQLALLLRVVSVHDAADVRQLPEQPEAPAAEVHQIEVHLLRRIAKERDMTADCSSVVFPVAGAP